jgi:hypothetical protein
LVLAQPELNGRFHAGPPKSNSMTQRRREEAENAEFSLGFRVGKFRDSA